MIKPNIKSQADARNYKDDEIEDFYQVEEEFDRHMEVKGPAPVVIGNVKEYIQKLAAQKANSDDSSNNSENIRQ